MENNETAYFTTGIWSVLKLSDDKQRNMLGNAGNV